MNVMDMTDRQLERRQALADLTECYRRMVEIRLVEERIQTLYEEGYIRGSTHLCIGQEAVCVGIAAASAASDYVTCTYRGHGLALALGVTPEEVLGEVAGRVIGCAGGLGGSMHLFGERVGLLPTFAIVGAGLPVAAGAALAAQVKGTNDAAIGVFGDGAVNIGAFHEALNLAAIWKLPVVFVCENNLYGEYSRINLTTPVEDLARRADSYGIPGVAVDGQELDAVTSAINTALDRARARKGPSLLEIKTYRYSGHSRSDAGTYRPPGELDAWKQRDPLDLCAARLRRDGVATAEQLARIRDETETTVAAACELALASPEPAVEEMFRHVLADGWDFEKRDVARSPGSTAAPRGSQVLGGSEAG
jgi:acetoin:2,6-dichlorophenolindophenol oxidoreductase subunit alpha